MATKNLARTIVEPARRPGFKWMQHSYVREERHAVKRHLRAVRTVDDAIETDRGWRRDSEWKNEGFVDNLRPLARFLRARAGRRWNDVFSDLCRKYDRRTVKGWHLLTLHLVWEVDLDHNNLGRAGGAWVDSAGVLRWRRSRYYG